MTSRLLLFVFQYGDQSLITWLLTSCRRPQLTWGNYSEIKLSVCLSSFSAKREKEVVHLHNFIRLIGWFGPFQPTPTGCLRRVGNDCWSGGSVIVNSNFSVLFCLIFPFPFPLVSVLLFLCFSLLFFSFLFVCLFYWNPSHNALDIFIYWYILRAQNCCKQFVCVCIFAIAWTLSRFSGSCPKRLGVQATFAIACWTLYWIT